MGVDETTRKLQNKMKDVNDVVELINEKARLVPGDGVLLKAFQDQIDACAAPIQTIEEKLNSRKSRIFKKVVSVESLLGSNNRQLYCVQY